jgi:hypothetical protein
MGFFKRAPWQEDELPRIKVLQGLVLATYQAYVVNNNYKAVPTT